MPSRLMARNVTSTLDAPARTVPAAQSGVVRIGISGWTYAGWRGVFYPKFLPRNRELNYSSQRFDTIEINGTFYGLQRPDAFARWREQSPVNFVFAVKGSRYITHFLKLLEPEIPLANFIASGVLRLGPKLGPILWQFSARTQFNPARFEAFLAVLPKTTEEAEALARRHDARVADRAWLRSDFDGPIRHAIEIRHDSFRVPAFIDLLRKYNIALVCADSVEWPLLMDLTSDFVYCRLHGSKELYVSGYDDCALNQWAARVRSWARGEEPADSVRVGPPSSLLSTGRDVFIFFDNDAKVRAPIDALALAARLETAA